MNEPLFLSVREASKILGISYWTVRDYVISGVLRRTNFPGTNGKGKLGKILIARAEIDRLIGKVTLDKEENGSRLPKGKSVVGEVLSEWKARLRVVEKPQKEGRR